jgi:WXG100 family type VII secretion target
MTRYSVDSDAVLAATTAVQASIGRIQSEVASLRGRLGDLQSSWGGQASIAFQSVVTDWTATQQRVEESLAAISGALGHAGRQYAEIEEANARLFR